MEAKLIAPCGMNCGLCLHYLRKENKCPGCFSGRKVNGRPIKCARRLCKHRYGETCFDCVRFPCLSIQTLDERYRLRYNMSVIDNLKYLHQYGMEAMIQNEIKRWVTEEGTYCVHDHKRYKP